MYEKAKKWFKIHPKVKAAFYGLGVVVLLNLQSNYDGAISLKEAAWRTYGGVLVAALAYLKSA